MKNNIWKIGLVIAVITILLGTSFTSSISIKTSSEPVGNNNEPQQIPVEDWEIIDTVGWWHFDEGSDSYAFDCSSYGNDGTCYSTEWTTDTPDGSPYALRFSKDYNSVVIVDDNPSLDFADLGEGEGFMIDFWMEKNQTPSPSHSGLVAKMYQGGYNVLLLPDGRVLFHIRNQDVYHYVYSNTKMDENWHHIVAIWSGDTMYMYVDDMSNPENSTYVGDFTLGEAGNNKWLDIGNDWPTDWDNPFDGMIDEVRISIIIPAGGNRLPCASFEWTPQYPDVNTPVTFDASESDDPDGEIISFEWDLGDGNIGTEEQITHTYTQPGQYEVELTVIDNDGAQAKLKKEITIESHRPTVEILNIKPTDEIVCGIVTITGSASDPNDDQTLQEVTVNVTNLIQTIPLPVEGTTSWTCEWNTNEFRDGPWKIIAKSQDNGGLVSDPDIQRVWVDNTPPLLPIILKPLNAIYRNDMPWISPFFLPVIIGPITIMVQVIDIPWGVKEVKYFIDGEFKHTDKNFTKSPISLSTWKYDDVDFGLKLLEFRAYDYCGNEKQPFFPKYIFKVI